MRQRRLGLALVIAACGATITTGVEAMRGQSPNDRPAAAVAERHAAPVPPPPTPPNQPKPAVAGCSDRVQGLASIATP